MEIEAYLAGLFDGEGSVCLSKRGRNYLLVVAVSNTEKELAFAFYKKYGGSFNKVNPSGLGIRPVYQWKISSQKASKFLKQLLPYFKSPKNLKRAKLAIKFQAQKVVNGNPGKAHIEKYRKVQSIFRKQMMIVNNAEPRND